MPLGSLGAGTPIELSAGRSTSPWPPGLKVPLKRHGRASTRPGPSLAVGRLLFGRDDLRLRRVLGLHLLAVAGKLTLMNILSQLQARFARPWPPAGRRARPSWPSWSTWCGRRKIAAFGDYQANLRHAAGQAAGPAAAARSPPSWSAGSTWPICASRPRSPGRASSICG